MHIHPRGGWPAGVGNQRADAVETGIATCYFTGYVKCACKRSLLQAEYRIQKSVSRDFMRDKGVVIKDLHLFFPTLKEVGMSPES